MELVSRRRQRLVSGQVFSCCVYEIGTKTIETVHEEKLGLCEPSSPSTHETFYSCKILKENSFKCSVLARVFCCTPTHEKNLFWSLKISSWRNRDPCTHVLSIISMGERDSDAKWGIWKFPPIEIPLKLAFQNLYGFHASDTSWPHNYFITLLKSLATTNPNRASPAYLPIFCPNITTFLLILRVAILYHVERAKR